MYCISDSCHQIQMGHSGEFWQNVVHCRREWQTTSVLLPRELINSMKREKYMTLDDEHPKSVGVRYATGEEQRNSSRKNELSGLKQKRCSGVNGYGVESKFQSCRQIWYIRTWNVRFMNQGKLDMVKQEMARVNINILGVSELKSTGMGEFNSDDHYIYYCGQESLRRNGVALIVNNNKKNTCI